MRRIVRWILLRLISPYREFDWMVELGFQGLADNGEPIWRER